MCDTAMEWRVVVALLVGTGASLCAGQVTDPVTSDVNINCGACKVSGAHTKMMDTCCAFLLSTHNNNTQQRAPVVGSLLRW